ncbi:VPA1269 family protein [Aeromonas hydrophila]|uniref:VPA1269 family protein n=1 Tax=Aeromonas hydrophila TaxID=644 RepID=UPI002B4667B2|nr:VPA1269 family protein [Aeromonas hydrophila]
MNEHINIHGVKLASGDDLSLFDKNQIMNLFQSKPNDKIPNNTLNALDFFEYRVRKGEFFVTSDFFFMTYGNKRFQRSLGVRLLSDAEKNTLIKYIENSGSLNSKKTEKAKEQALKQYLFTAVAAKLALSVSSVDQISFQQWQEFVKPLRTDNDRWNEDFMGPFQAAGVRDLGTCLANIHHNPQFIAILKVIRSDRNNLGQDMLTNPPEHIIQWVNAWRHYIESSGNYTVHVYITAFYRFKIYLEEIYQGKEIPSPMEFFSSRRTDSFIDWVEHQNFDGKDAAVSTVHQNVQFSHWFINMYLSEHDEDDNGNKTTVAFPLIRNAQLEAFKGKYRRSDLKPGESTKESPPLWLRERLKNLLSEDDYAWPKSISSEYSTFAVDGNGEFLWVPTNTFIYLIMLEIPVRKIQLLRSDSGEGDVIKYDRNSDQWILNTSISANYWKNDPSVKVINRGIIRQHKTDNKKGQNLVLYINSNKTQDKDTGFTEFSGYEIPWKHPEVIRLISELRSWQEKNNPCLTPVKAIDVPDAVYPKTLNEAIAKGLPDRFFLFRSAREVRGAATRHMPPTERSIGLFWNAAMDELEKRLRSEGLDIQLVLNRNEHGQAQEVLYTPHSLRVAGLTSLAEQGVPIEVLSKLVAGHKSILMTIYYIKHDYAHITEVLNEASHKTLLESQESFSRWIKEGTWDQISKYAVYNNEESAKVITNPNQIAINGIWNSTHLGLCPYGGTRCNDGGGIIRKNPVKYSPVAEKDCVNCRHILTGRPWLVELTVHGNKLLLEIEKKLNKPLILTKNATN